MRVGGGSGIRTHDTVSRIHAFQACAFSHSAIPPAGSAGASHYSKAVEGATRGQPATRDRHGAPLSRRRPEKSALRPSFQASLTMRLSIYPTGYSEARPVSRAQMLASVYDIPLAERKATPLVKLMDVAARNAERGGRLKPEPGPDGAAGRRRRAQIWEISPNLHCSIIGT